VQDPRDGRKYPAGPCEVAPAGEYHRGAETPLEKLQKERGAGLRAGLGATGLRAAGLRSTGLRSTGYKPVLPVTFRPEADSNVLHMVRQTELRESGLDIPASPPKAGCASLSRPTDLEELAAGVEVVEQGSGARGQGSEEQLFGSPLERYEFLLIKQARGEVLAQDEAEFMAWFRAEHRDFMRTSGAALEKQAQLRAVE